MKDFIQLKNKGIIKIGLKDSEGKEILDDKGNIVCLEFDLEDIELPLKYNKCDYQHQKNVEYLRNQFLVIDKKEDKKGKFLLSANQEAKAKALKEFYQNEIKALDLFLGEGGTKKLLNGRSPYWDMFDDISNILKPIEPLLKQGFDNVFDKIKSKYSKKQEENVIK